MSSSPTNSIIGDITAGDQSELSDADENGHHFEFDEGTDQLRVAADPQQKFLCEKTAKMELENKLLQAVRREQKLLAEHNALQAKVAKMKQEQQQQQNDIESNQKTILESIVRMEGAQQQQMNSLKEQIGKCVAQTELCAKIDQLERKQTTDFEQMKNIYNAHFAKIDKKISLPLQNLWDANACHNALKITAPKRLGVHYKGNSKYGYRSVIAKNSILSSAPGIFYFEIKVENVKFWVVIGLATKAMPLDRLGVGWYSDSYGYESYGDFWINGSSKNGKSSFSAGDVVGCGVNLATRQIIFTKNGQRLDTTDSFISSSPFDSFFPCVSLFYSGDKIEANFGPHFRFDVGTLC